MKKIKTKCGYVAYVGSRAEVIVITRGLGLCDFCSTAQKTMYLVPIINSTLCKRCYDSWNARAVYYPEDIPYEKSQIHKYKTMMQAFGVKVSQDNEK